MPFICSREVLDLCVTIWSNNNGRAAFSEMERPFQHKCLLCNSRSFEDSTMMNHLCEPRHQALQSEFHRDLKRIEEMLRRLTRLFSSPTSPEIRRIGQIGDPTRRDAVQAELFRYLTTCANDSMNQGDVVVDGDGCDLLEHSIMRIKLYECEEGLILLALAVWKAQCVRHMPENADYLSSRQWVLSEWKTRKAELRDTASMATGIIVAAVRPFVHAHARGTFQLHPDVSAASNHRTIGLSCQFKAHFNATLAHLNEAQFLYIEPDSACESPKFRCVLCNHGGMDNEYATTDHLRELWHLGRCKMLRGDLWKLGITVTRYIHAFTMSAELIVPLNRIRHLPWRDTVQAELYRFMFQHEGTEPPLDMVRKFEHWERQVIVALAVWKSRCLLEMPKGLGYVASQQWAKSGWKALKMEKRRSSAVPMVLDLLRPFLDPPALVRVQQQEG
jgi:hypothetical protein